MPSMPLDTFDRTGWLRPERLHRRQGAGGRINKGGLPRSVPIRAAFRSPIKELDMLGNWDCQGELRRIVDSSIANNSNAHVAVIRKSQRGIESILSTLNGYRSHLGD